MPFFPFVFSIFFFVLLANLIGFIPYSMAVTSHIVITTALALIVFFAIVIIGVRARPSFLQALRPPRRAIYILRSSSRSDRVLPVAPLNHSVRLFANMLTATFR